MNGGPVAVALAASDVQASWLPDRDTLPELAEASGLNPDFSCRSGICGIGATHINCGTFDYLKQPSAPMVTMRC